MVIIFDWDGTLHKTEKIYGNAFRKAYNHLVELGIEEPYEYSNKFLSKYLGMNSIDMWNDFRPNLPDKLKQETSDAVGAGMIDQMKNGHAELYDGVLQLLETLKEKGHQLIILSNCKRPYQQAYRAVFDLDRWFSDYYNCQEYGFAPKEEIFNTIKEKYNGPFVIVGDRSSDIEVAKVHHITGIGCDYGYGQKDELNEADFRVIHPLEILDVISNLEN